MTVLFSDLEGRLHMLDYDKKFLVKSWDNLTLRRLFDPRLYGTARERPEARHGLGRLLLGPGDVFGAGKVMVFGEVIDKDGGPYSAGYPRRPESVTQRDLREVAATP